MNSEEGRGRNEELKTGARFVQSGRDFPCVVGLGKEQPAWEISRWGNTALRFVPGDEEGFSFRGDSRCAHYAGRRKSHRFTVLGDESFEYDCILNKEPESNVLTFRLEGAERFDFFRQPDTLKNPLLAGSYAVYKKETFPGEGTGKLCHIHRPEIFDAAGRSVWGDVRVCGNKLFITIPEDWLSEARYPVVADPVVGTSTVGSQYLFLPPGFDEEEDEPWELTFEMELAVNRFPVPQTIPGQCTAYVYSYYRDSDAGGRAVLYSDQAGKPLSRKTLNENLTDFDTRPGKPEGWRSGSFSVNETIPAGSYVWFGVFAEYYFYPRFDYGATLYHYWYEHLGYGIPATFPGYASYNMKLSMYFDYTSSQVYTRTLTQGISLSEAQTRKGSFVRIPAMTASGTGLLHRTGAYTRTPADGVRPSGLAGRRKGMFRLVSSFAGITDTISRCRALFRSVAEVLRIATTGKRTISLRRGIEEQAGAGTGLARVRGFVRLLIGMVSALDTQNIVLSWLRLVREDLAASGGAGRTGDYIRGLYAEAGGTAETLHAGEYHRKQEDAAGTADIPLRSLFVVVKLITAGPVRDYLISRFLRSNEDMAVKSAVCREIILESRIH
jgi:hypothetical protein